MPNPSRVVLYGGSPDNLAAQGQFWAAQNVRTEEGNRDAYNRAQQAQNQWAAAVAARQNAVNDTSATWQLQANQAAEAEAAAKEAEATKVFEWNTGRADAKAENEAKRKANQAIEDARVKIAQTNADLQQKKEASAIKVRGERLAQNYAASQAAADAANEAYDAHQKALSEIKSQLDSEKDPAKKMALTTQMKALELAGKSLEKAKENHQSDLARWLATQGFSYNRAKNAFEHDATGESFPVKAIDTKSMATATGDTGTANPFWSPPPAPTLGPGPLSATAAPVMPPNAGPIFPSTGGFPTVAPTNRFAALEGKTIRQNGKFYKVIGGVPVEQ